MRILLVEDERKTAEALQQGLEGDGYSVEIAHSGEEGFFRLNSGEFDLAILDVMLPGRTGVEVLFTARRTGLRIPLIKKVRRVGQRVRMETAATPGAPYS